MIPSGISSKRRNSLIGAAIVFVLSVAVAACSTGSQAKESTPRARVAFEAPTATPTRVRQPLAFPTFPPPSQEELDAEAAAAAAKTPTAGGGTKSSSGAGAPSGPLLWSSEVTDGRGSFKGGSTSTIQVSVAATQSATALVEVEIYNPTGAQVFQTAMDNVSFSPNARKSFDVTWPIPSNPIVGPYTVSIGVFQPGGGSPYSLNSNAFVYYVTR